MNVTRHGRVLLIVVATLVAACGSTPASTTDPTALAPASPTASTTPTATTAPTVAAATPTTRPATTPAATSAARQELDIAESGFTAFEGDTPYAQYGVVIANPNKSGWAASDVTVTMAFYDSVGNVLTTEEENISFILPGQRSGIGDTAFDTQGADSMDVTVDVDSWEEIDFEPGTYTASRVKVKQDDYETQITGILKCSFAKDQENVKVVALLRNKAGKIIGGESTYVDKIRCDKGTPFSMSTLGRLRRAVTAEILPSN